MFAVLKILENEKGIIARIKMRFNPPEPKLERISVKGAAPFYYLEIYENQCGVNFENIADILGRCARFIIPCGQYHIPDTALTGIFRAERLPQLMLVNTALSFAERNISDKSATSIGFIDKSASYRDIIDKFINKASIIKVYTDFPDRYASLCEMLLNEWGFSLIVSPNPETVSGCDIIISPETNQERIYNRTIVYNEKINKMRIVYRGEGIVLPEEYKKLLPQGIDELVFASALYELCGAKTIGTMCYSKLVKCDESFVKSRNQ